MISKGVKLFLVEIDRLEYLDIDKVPFTQDSILVNGITGNQGFDFYSRKIDSLYQDFLKQIGKHDFQDLIKVKHALEESIVKQQNFYKLERYRSQRQHFEFDGNSMNSKHRTAMRLKKPIIDLYEKVYFKQFDVLSKAEKRVREILLSIDPNRDSKVDAKHLFNMVPEVQFNRVFQRLTKTLTALELINKEYGGTANNLKLLFDRTNPNLVQPIRIRWQGTYEELQFFVFTLRDQNFIVDERNGLTSFYHKAYRWFSNSKGVTFEESRDSKKIRFRGRKSKHGESDEIDHLYPEETDQGIRVKLTTKIRTKLTTLIRSN